MKTKNNQHIFAITSVVCLLPLIFSAVVYGRLPDQIAVHWNNAGIADNYLPKAIAAFGLPILFLALNVMLTKMRKVGDLKNESWSRANASLQILVWTAPVLSVILVPVTLLLAMGMNIPIVMVGSLLVGLALIYAGNYFPKTRQNSFVGIKLPWTLRDEDNWNKTHRLAGYVYVASGVLLIVSSFMLKNTTFYIWIYGVIIAILALFPTIYSYLLFKRKGMGKK